MFSFSYVKKPNTSNWSFMEMYLHVQDSFNHLLTFNKNSYGKVEPVCRSDVTGILKHHSNSNDLHSGVQH